MSHRKVRAVNQDFLQSIDLLSTFLIYMLHKNKAVYFVFLIETYNLSNTFEGIPPPNPELPTIHKRATFA